MKLTLAEKAALRNEIFTTRPEKPCEDCGGYHLRQGEKACPRIKRKVFHPNGNLIEVEYFRHWDDSDVIWPDDAFDPEDANER